MSTASGRLFRTATDAVMRASLFWNRNLENDALLVDKIRARWFASLYRADEELGFDDKHEQSFLRRGRHCPSLGHSDRLDKGCHLPFCPQCWARRRAVQLWKTLYTGLRPYDCRHARLIWITFRDRQQRSDSSVVDVRRMRTWLEEHPEIRHYGKIAVMQRNLTVLGSIVVTRVYPEESHWMIDHTSLVLLPDTKQLRDLRARGKTTHWNFHDDWSNDGLARLIGLVFRYPYQWLSASGEDWIAFSEYWKRMHVFATSGAFRNSITRVPFKWDEDQRQ